MVAALMSQMSEGDQEHIWKTVHMYASLRGAHANPREPDEAGGPNHVRSK